MSLHCKAVLLDANGHGTVYVSPTYFMGAKGGGVSQVTAQDGQNCGTAFLSRGAAIAVEGEVDVFGGTPSADCELYFDPA